MVQKFINGTGVHASHGKYTEEIEKRLDEIYAKVTTDPDLLDDAMLAEEFEAQLKALIAALRDKIKKESIKEKDPKKINELFANQ